MMDGRRTEMEGIYVLLWLERSLLPEIDWFAA